MKSPFLVLSLLPVLFLFSFTNADLPIQNYINQYNVIAIQEMNRTGIPASITLAQGIIESRYGMSGLAKNSNNHFGIKCKGNWTGGKYYHKDDDYVNGKLIKSCFRTYNTPEESYYDHSEFLMNNQRYHFLFSFEKTDYKSWAKGLKKAGYATAKNYANSLISTIEKYKLYQYDKMELDLLTVQSAELIPPKAEKIPKNLYFSRPAIKATTNSETLVASTPPPPTLLPPNYRVGDGLKSIRKDNNAHNFYSDVYGTSSLFLEEITPKIVGRD